MPIVALDSKNATFVKTLEQNVLLLVCALPLLVPFGLTRNLGLQAIVVILTGILAWTSVILRKQWRMVPTLILLLMGVYVSALLISSIINGRLLNFTGSALFRLGSLELIACVGIGLCLKNLTYPTLTKYIYLSLVLLAICSLPFGLLHGNYDARVSGLLYQPDLLATLLALGIMFGYATWQLFVEYRIVIGLAQLYLFILLLLTQTRAVLALLIALSIAWLTVSNRSFKYKLVSIVLCICFVITGIGVMSALSHNRLSDPQLASKGVSYRFDLLTFSISHITDKPFAGYGAASVRNALQCSPTMSPALRKTCDDGYYFNSSHNIYLDRILGIGWIGGASFICLLTTLLWYGRKQHLFVFSSLLISLYYFTNVTGLLVELMLMVCILQLIPNKALDIQKHKQYN